jgi:hypothetical protein
MIVIMQSAIIINILLFLPLFGLSLKIVATASDSKINTDNIVKAPVTDVLAYQ